MGISPNFCLHTSLHICLGPSLVNPEETEPQRFGRVYGKDPRNLQENPPMNRLDPLAMAPRKMALQRIGTARQGRVGRR